MKKVLILAYFYPPCNLTAARRAEAFAVFLNKFGYYPVVVTREWFNEINSPADVLKNSGDKLRIVKNDEYEIHYLPYKSSFRDRLFISFGKTKLKFLSKILTIIGLIGQNYSNLFIPYRNLYQHSLKLIKSESIAYAVITANPFEIFKFGYLLNRKTKIKWIADYRDDWNTSELVEYKNKNRVLKQIESHFEKKWLGSASHITSISPHYVRKIENFTACKGSVILNGHNFNSDNVAQVTKAQYYDNFTIVYNGSLYSSQAVEIFLKGFIIALDKLNKNGLQILFPGLAYDKVQKQRVTEILKNYENNFKIYERLAHKEVIEMQNKSHLMLMIPHTGIKGISSSKLYEYIGLRKHVILCPSDSDIIEETLSNCGLGIILNNEEEIANYLVNAAQNKQSWENIKLSDKQLTAILSYSRENQIEKLSKLLDHLK